MIQWVVATYFKFQPVFHETSCFWVKLGPVDRTHHLQGGNIFLTGCYNRFALAYDVQLTKLLINSVYHRI